MKKKIFFVLMIMALLAAGCGGTQPVENADAQVFEDAVNTAVAETQAAASQEEAVPETAVQVEAEQAADAGHASEVSRASTSQLVSNAASSAEVEAVEEMVVTDDVAVPAFSADASSSSSDDDKVEKPCYQAEFVGETIPDGSVFSPGDGFVKSWTLKNTGRCEWGKSFTFEYVYGNFAFRAPKVSKLTNKQILPKDTITISLEMGAPTEPGHYLALYKIYNENGVVITPNGVWVSIWVDYPDPDEE